MKILIFNSSRVCLVANKKEYLVGRKKQLPVELTAEAQGAYTQSKAKYSTP